MEHVGSQMSPDRCGVTEICLWHCKEEILSLEKNTLPLEADNRPNTLEQCIGSIVCSLFFLMSPILLHVWKVVCLVAKCQCC